LKEGCTLNISCTCGSGGGGGGGAEFGGETGKNCGLGISVSSDTDWSSKVTVSSLFRAFFTPLLQAGSANRPNIGIQSSFFML
jgi:hypothetical protein